jgi:hypothetical protein
VLGKKCYSKSPCRSKNGLTSGSSGKGGTMTFGQQRATQDRTPLHFLRSDGIRWPKGGDVQ